MEIELTPQNNRELSSEDVVIRFLAILDTAITKLPNPGVLQDAAKRGSEVFIEAVNGYFRSFLFHECSLAQLNEMSKLLKGSPLYETTHGRGLWSYLRGHIDALERILENTERKK